MHFWRRVSLPSLSHCYVSFSCNLAVTIDDEIVLGGDLWFKVGATFQGLDDEMSLHSAFGGRGPYLLIMTSLDEVLPVQSRVEHGRGGGSDVADEGGGGRCSLLVALGLKGAGVVKVQIYKWTNGEPVTMDSSTLDRINGAINNINTRPSRDSEWVHVKTKLGLVLVGGDEDLKDPSVWSSNVLQLAIELAAPAAAATPVGKGRRVWAGPRGMTGVKSAPSDEDRNDVEAKVRAYFEESGYSIIGDQIRYMTFDIIRAKKIDQALAVGKLDRTFEPHTWIHGLRPPGFVSKIPSPAEQQQQWSKQQQQQWSQQQQQQQWSPPQQQQHQHQQHQHLHQQ